MPDERVGPRSLRRLLEAAVAISSDLDLEAVLRRVVEAAVELVDARYGALGVLDEGRSQLAEFIVVGVDDDTRRAIGELPKGLGLLGSLIREARPLRLADLHEHADSAGFPDGHPPMSSFLGVPIRIRDEVYGNLYLTDKTTGEVFTDVDEELALGLASAAAVAIDNARLFEGVRRREATLAAMHEVAGALVAGVEPAEILALIARRARELVGAELATIALPQPDGETLCIEVADGDLADGLLGERFPRAGSVSGEVLRSGDAVVVEDASRDHRLRQPQVQAGCVGPAAWVPLVFDGKPFGTLSVARSVRSAPFAPGELEVIRSFAAQASVILEHNRSRRNLQRLELLEDQERIARDLHDTVIQRLFATGMSLQAVIRVVEDPVARERVSAAVDELDVTIRHIRTVIFGLEERRSARVTGVRSRVLELTTEASRSLGFEPRVAFSGPVDSLVGESIAVELLAALREALSNVARHAGAGQVDVQLSADGGGVELLVVDDGAGLDPTGAARSPGRGLDNMRARALHHGGQFSLEAAAPRGTRLRWTVPLPVG